MKHLGIVAALILLLCVAYFHQAQTPAGTAPSKEQQVRKSAPAIQMTEPKMAISKQKAIPAVDVGGEVKAVGSAMRTFFDAILQGNVASITEGIFKIPGSEARAASRASRLAERCREQGKVPAFVDAQALDTIAIAFTRDTVNRPSGETDYDAVTLLKRDGKWLVVMGNAEIEDRADVLTDDERKQLAQLRQWQDTRMRELSPPN